MKKVIGIVSFRKNILGWLGDRTTAPSLLVWALYRCDHQAVANHSKIYFLNLYFILYHNAQIRPYCPGVIYEGCISIALLWNFLELNLHLCCMVPAFHESKSWLVTVLSDPVQFVAWYLIYTAIHYFSIFGFMIYFIDYFY